jgi:hypothetical protein
MSAGMRDGPAIILRSWRTVVKASRSFRDDHHVVELYVGCAKEISRRGERSSTRIANGEAPRRVLQGGLEDEGVESDSKISPSCSTRQEKRKLWDLTCF